MEHINQKFNILSALGIILVVGGHCSVNFIHQFPVYSFHMPLFIFISGYFFHAHDFRTFLTKKVKHLLIPFLLWNAFYGVIINWLAMEGWTQIGHAPLSLKSLLWDPFTTGWPFIFNGPAWFVGSLFFVQLLYWFLYKITGNRVLIIGIIAILSYFLSLYLTFHGWSSWGNHAGIGIERILFFLIFYYLGGIYKTYIENRSVFSIKNALLVIFSCFLINELLRNTINAGIAYNVHQMKFPAQSYWLPMITACTGICLYLQFANFIIYKVRNYHILNFIGRHTYSVMTHHQFFFWLTNTVLWFTAQHNLQLLTYFDYKKYMTEIYYHIDTPYPREDYIYLLAGLCGPLFCCWFYDRFIQQRWHEIRDRVPDLVK